MTISATNSVTSPQAMTTTSSTGGLKGTTDEFLKLFMAQLQHQDPLDPKSGADMVAQLAQMTAVEQTRQTNQQLADLSAAQASVASASLSSLVGRTCNAATGAFDLDSKGAPPPIAISSTAPTKDAALVVTDAAGKEIRRIPIPNGTTATTLQWDGKDASGNPVAPGSYSMSVDAGTSSAPITSQWQGRVDAVELTPEGPRLRIGGVLVAPATISTIGGTAANLTDLISTISAQGATP